MSENNVCTEVPYLTVMALFFCWPPSLTRGRICLLYMLLVLASAVFLGSESLETAPAPLCPPQIPLDHRLTA
jgi:hypothetical protein